VTSGTFWTVTDCVAVRVTLPEVKEAPTVTDWSLATAAVVSTPPAIDAKPEFSLQVAFAVTFWVVPSENVAVAAYVAVLLSGTVAGPVMARLVRLFVVPPSQFEGAPETARSTLACPCVARTRHGTLAGFSMTAFQLPLSSARAVPSTAPVAAFAMVTEDPAGAVPETESLSPPQDARVMARLAAAADAATTHRSATTPQILSFMIDDSSFGMERQTWAKTRAGWQ